MFLTYFCDHGFSEQGTLRKEIKTVYSRYAERTVYSIVNTSACDIEAKCGNRRAHRKFRCWKMASKSKLIIPYLLTLSSSYFAASSVSASFSQLSLQSTRDAHHMENVVFTHSQSQRPSALRKVKADGRRKVSAPVKNRTHCSIWCSPVLV